MSASKLRLRPLWALVLAGLPAAGHAGPAAEDLTSLELEQLMAMEVSGVTGRSGNYANTPAAVWVISGDDIRRSGVRSIPEILRLAPGVQVARRSAQDYTVTSRGFGGDKLQVLVDGRSVYSPLQSEVFWDVLDTYLEDIARIEVIRGPGATLWGANAVNGVINIVTKPSGDSRGVHVHGGGGIEERAFGGFRAGGAISDWGNGRLYAQGRERDSTVRADGSDSPDGMSQVQAGARLDGELDGLGLLTFSGDIYSADLTSGGLTGAVPMTGRANGRNAGVRWRLPHANGAETLASAYYDGYDRELPQVYGESRDTWDFGLQQNFGTRGAHRFTAGLGTRVSHDRTAGPPDVIVFTPPSVTRSLYSAFVQDEIALGDWNFVLGSKVEHNDYTGFEFQPGVRVGWQVTAETFTWAAVSRATRTPNRLDDGLQLVCLGVNDPPTPLCNPPFTTTATTYTFGNPAFRSERLVAYEWGLRQQLAARAVADLSLFYNDYRDLRSIEPPGFTFDNRLAASSYGGELTLSWDPLDSLRLQAFYGYLRISAWRADGGADPFAGAAALEGGSPENRAGLRASWQIVPDVAVDGWIRYVDALEAQSVPDYTALNLRVSWQVTPLFEIALAGQNLTDPSHPESGSNPATRNEIERNVSALFAWRWQ